MKISNSGKTITIRMPDGMIGRRFTITYTLNNVVILQRVVEGGHLVHGTNCMTINAKHYPGWPVHGQIDVPETWETLNSKVRFSIPDGPLPPVKIINRKKKLPAERVDEIKEHAKDAIIGVQPIFCHGQYYDPPKDNILPPKPEGYYDPRVFSDETPAVEPTEEVMFRFKNRDYFFNVPVEELIDLAIDWGSRGFSAR